MPIKTNIGWTGTYTPDGVLERGYSSNPIKARRKSDGKRGWHCTKTSPGCANCYSEAVDHRFGTGAPFTEKGSTEVDLYIDERELKEIQKLSIRCGMNSRKKVFLCDMTDLFHDDVPESWLDLIFATIAASPNLTFQLLTKRAERMLEYTTQGYMPGRLNDARILHNVSQVPIKQWPLANVWLGVSVEDFPRKSRMDVLRMCPAVHRFVSYEPLLEDLGALELEGIDWGIIGSESGGRARPMKIPWAEDIVNQYWRRGLALFTKQIATRKGKEHGDAKGENPEYWPPGNWPRTFPGDGS